MSHVVASSYNVQLSGNKEFYGIPYHYNKLSENKIRNPGVIKDKGCINSGIPRVIYCFDYYV